MPTMVEKFWDAVDKKGPDDCWEWKKGRTTFGYGSFYLPGSIHIPSHKFSWELVNEPVPKGLCVLHKCDNPPCVNPNHLFIGTKKDNAIDAAKKKRLYNPKGEDHNCAKLTEAQVLEIRRRYKFGTALQIDLAKEYGVTRRHLNEIICRKVWRHI